MHHVTFYPLGNADTTLVELARGKVILFDYAHVKCAEDETDKRCNLKEELNKAVTKDTFDAVCFTHLDADHVVGADEYFYFEHSKLYQGGNRKKIKELWVPAEAITESKNSCNKSAQVIQAEARYRLKYNLDGIRVFSRPKKFKEWCDRNEGYDYDKIEPRIVNAGETVPSVTLANDGAEFFAHCPFYSDSRDVDRNNNAIVVQCTFDNAYSSKLLLGSDIGYKVWEDIIIQTQLKGNEERLQWDMFHLSHHCSYKSLAEEKGTTKTDPSDTLRWLYEDKNQVKQGAIIISPSKPIPIVYGPTENEQPPHKQAYNYYNEDSTAKVVVTMQEPTVANPKPLKYKIGATGIQKVIGTGSLGGSRPSEGPSRAGSL